MNALVSFVNAFFTSLQVALKWVLDGGMWILKTVLFVILDGLFTVIVSFVSAIDLSTVISSGAASWAGLPPQMLYLVNQCGIPQGLSLITGAIVVRMIINLIPAAFTRI